MELKSSYVNQYFDHVYVLNLEKRPDRKVAMLQKLSRLGIMAEFVEAVDGNSLQNKQEHQIYLEKPIGTEGSHPLEISQQRKLITSAGAWGYLKTYLGILKDAKKRGFGRILCFDDDVLFHKDFENQFLKGIQIIPEDWKLLYLGASQYVWKIPQGLAYTDSSTQAIDANETFYFPKATDGSFAMGIDFSVFDLLIHDILKMDCPFDSGPLRSVIGAYPKKCFVLHPNLVIADVSESDIRDGQDQQRLAEQLKWNMDDYDFPFQQDLISVIMPAFNAEKTIEKSIRSILMQTYKSLEIIVVDDASSDNTTNVVAQIAKEDSRVRLITMETNKGVGGARNEGIKSSKGNIIAFQDADDISLKERLGYQLIPLYTKGMLFTVCKIYRSRCTIEELDIFDQDATLTLVKSRRIKNKAGSYDYRDTAEVGLVTTLFNRSVFEEYGLFDELRFGEDMRMIERILYYKLKIIFEKSYNGHTYLCKHSSVPNTFKKLDIPMYISPEMGDGNLTVQYQKNIRKKLLVEQTFREKLKSGELDQFPNLPASTSLTKIFPFKYNTLKLDTFVMLPEIEHQMLLSRIEDAKEQNIQSPTVDDIYNSLSWRITAPLRWILDMIK